MENDDVVEQVVSKAANPPFGSSVLPGAAIAGADGSNAGGLQKLPHLGAELGVSIKDQVLAIRAFGVCFAKLLHYPLAGRMFSHIQVDDLSAAVPD